MSVVAIIQARTGSTRLPNKVLLPLVDKPVLQHVIERTDKANLIDEVIVATTIEKPDLKIVNFVSSLGYRVFAGSTEDVLDRYFQVAKLIKPHHIVRITADCPVIDPEIIDYIVDIHLSNKNDLTYTGLSYPDGLDVGVFTYELLFDTWKNATLKSDREHVGPYMTRREDIKKQVVEYEKDLSHIRLTLDEKQDYELLKIIFEELYPKNKDFKFKDILKLLEEKPDLIKINSHIERNEGYKKSLQNDGFMQVEDLK